MQRLVAALVAFIAMVVHISSALTVVGPLVSVPVELEPAVKAFSNDGTHLYLLGSYGFEGRGKKPVKIPIKGLKANGIDGRRELLGDGIICNLVNISIGATNINVAGIVIDLPDGLNVDVTGQVGLLGELLCSLLGGGALLSDILAGLEGVVDGVNDLSDALDYLTNVLNNLVSL